VESAEEISETFITTQRRHYGSMVAIITSKFKDLGCYRTWILYK